MSDKNLIETYFELENIIYKRICQRCYAAQVKNKANKDKDNLQIKKQITSWSIDVL